MNFFVGAKIVNFDEVMTAISQTANFDVFRLECLQTYTSSEEEEDIALFKQGHPPNDDGMRDWLSLIKTNRGRGVRMKRVRVVKEPLSEYTRFEIEWGYKFSDAAGEEILSITPAQLEALAKNIEIIPDFWLIDKKIGYVLLYDSLGRHISNVRVSEQDLRILLDIHKEALAVAVPMKSNSYWGAECQ